MDFEYIGIDNANIEGRYNDMHYFIDKISNLNDYFLTNTKSLKNMYKDTNEFDNIEMIPYEKGLLFRIDNDDPEIENNDTNASLIVTDSKIYYIITKADWDFNRNSEVEQGANLNKEKETEIISTLGEPLKLDKVFSYEQSKEFLIKFAQKRQERIQKEKFNQVFTTYMNKLKESLSLFDTDNNLKSMKEEQELLKEKSDSKENLKKEIDAIPDNIIDILYQYHNGEIDQKSAIALINNTNMKNKLDNKEVSQEEFVSMLNFALKNDSVPTTDMVEEKTNDNSDWK